MATTPLPFTGFYNVPRLNISTCAVPKGGSSMMRSVVARMAGALPEGQCYYNWGRELDQALAAKGVTTWHDPSLTTVLQVRDPWTRAVSQFADQIVRGHVRGDPRNASDFVAYLRAAPLRPYEHHTGTASMYCAGRPGVRFDHVIDLEDIPSFHRAAMQVPVLGAALNRGWERCTHGVGSLYMVGTIAAHRSEPRLAQQLCTREALELVCRVYAADYALYRRLGHPYACECAKAVRGRPAPGSSQPLRGGQGRAGEARA